jgi:hypothetical protein
VDEPAPDVDFDFGNMITEQRLERWESAAASTGASFEDFVTTWLDAAANAIERTGSDAYSTPKRLETSPFNHAGRPSARGPQTRITKGFSNDPELTQQTPFCPAEAEAACSNHAGRMD